MIETTPIRAVPLSELLSGPLPTTKAERIAFYQRCHPPAWKWDETVNVLWCDDQWLDGKGYRYEVDLDTCRSAGAVLHWITHIAAKNWHSDVVRDLVIALREAGYAAPPQV